MTEPYFKSDFKMVSPFFWLGFVIITIFWLVGWTSTEKYLIGVLVCAPSLVHLAYLLVVEGL